MEIRIPRVYLEELNRRRCDPRADLFIPNGVTIFSQDPRVSIVAFQIGPRYRIKEAPVACLRAG